MTVTLVKCSLPNVWRKDFPDLRSASIGLRNHICRTCVEGDEWHDPLDIEFEGERYVCLDPLTLLSTPCGLEFELEGDHGLWIQDDDIDHNMFRHSRRKHTEAQLSA